MSRFLVFLLLAGLSLSHVVASSVQEQAEFLAGMPLSRNSPLVPFQECADYRHYQQELQEQWAFCKRIRYESMQQWGHEHLGQNRATRGVVRYLFGGPDFLNAHAFFPNARIMVLGGLEPVGEVPPPETLTPEAMSVGLKALREALHNSLFCGYFITSEMRPQLLQGSFRGVLPVLFTELALTENQILSVEMVKPFGSPGVKILYARFDLRADTQPQILYYFQADLSNGKEGTRFLNWLGALGNGVSYLKAASYLLPLDSFSQTREFLLKTSALILQDDSGIPFADFHTDLWKVQLFGVYLEPLAVFKLHRDPAMETGYASSAYGGPLGFGVGYHVKARDANLLLATRINERKDSVAYPSAIIPMPEAMSTPTPTPKPTRTARSSKRPKPTPIPIRKALPVDANEEIEIRKALPVEEAPMDQSQPAPTPAVDAIPAPSEDKTLQPTGEPSQLPDPPALEKL